MATHTTLHSKTLRNKTASSAFLPSKPYSFKYLFLTLVLSLFLVACGEQNEDTSNKTEIPVLTKDNINEFTLTFADTYLDTVDSLLTEFKKYKKKDDPYGFAQYRNYVWTPEYIEKKNYYLATVEKNRVFLEKSKIKPLFNKFDNLIYYGIDLKRSLLEKDRKLLDETVAKLKEQEAVVNAVIKSVGLETSFKQVRKGQKPASAPLNIITN